MCQIVDCRDFKGWDSKKLLFKLPKGEGCLFPVTPFYDHQVQDSGSVWRRDSWHSRVADPQQFFSLIISVMYKRDNIFFPCGIHGLQEETDINHISELLDDSLDQYRGSKIGDEDQELGGKAALRMWHSS